MIIDKGPQYLHAFLTPLSKRLTKPQRARLWKVLAAWVLTGSVGKVLYRARGCSLRHRTSLAAFLTRSDWDSADLQRAAVLRELKRLAAQPGEVLEWIIDDSRLAKRARQMAAVAKSGIMPSRVMSVATSS